MRYCSYGLFNLILSRFFIGYWILKRGWISILAPFFVSSESVVLSSEPAHDSQLTSHDLHQGVTTDLFCIVCALKYPKAPPLILVTGLAGEAD